MFTFLSKSVVIAVWHTRLQPPWVGKKVHSGQKGQKIDEIFDPWRGEDSLTFGFFATQGPMLSWML